MIRRWVLLLAAMGGLITAAPQAFAADPAFDADRKAILALAGDYKVTFDFKETVAYRPDYKLFPEKLSGGHETVRVIEDAGRVIRLQHILVAGPAADPVLVKHWREDWAYEPTSVLVYDHKDHWATKAVPGAARAHAWSQVVWQTDDSPRYGGVGRWRHEAGVSRWTSDDTARPLARRDATRHPVYDAYAGINRISLTPTGWVHEQDNDKLVTAGGKRELVAHEIGVNSYVRDASFPIAKADAYWAATAGYWNAVRAAWDGAVAKGGGRIHVGEEAENGAMTGPALMGAADTIAEGKIAEPAAIVQARALIAEETAKP